MTEDIVPERYEPDWNLLESAQSEGHFMEASFYLLKEAAVWMAIIASSMPFSPSDRNEAILRGLAVRLTKLMRLTLRELMAKETFQQLDLSRDIIETIANLVYLMGDDGGGSRFDKYIMNSLIAERELLRDINRNIAARGGDSLPIEDRMMRSIQTTAKAAGINDVSALPRRKDIGWPSAEMRVQQLGPDAYTAYRMGSVQTHGDWTDLFRNHLSYDDDQFRPNMESFEVRPQVPLLIAGLFTTFVASSLEYFLPGDVAADLAPVLRDLHDRVWRLNDLHERLLESDTATK